MSNIAWDKFYNANGRFYLLPNLALAEFCERMDTIAANKVLDLGCGSGRNMIYMAEKGFDIEGVDFSPEAVRIANQWLENEDLDGKAIVGDIHEKLKMYPNAEFDAIIAVNSLNYQSSDEFLRSIKEINRLLRTGGLALIIVPSQQAIILKPEIEQIFINEEALRIALKDRLEILHLYMDDEKNYVVIAKESKKA